jgi:hypothetical protein
MLRRALLTLVLLAPVVAWAGGGKIVELDITGMT